LIASLDSSPLQDIAPMKSIDRRRLMTGIAGLALAPGLRARAAPAPATLALTETASGVHVHRGRHALFSPDNAGDIANTGFVVGREAVAVVDTGGSANVGKALLAAIRSVTDLPVRYVINTHMHPDHVLGNAAFLGEGVAFVAHHKMARGLAARAERYLAVNRGLVGEEAFAGTEIVLPTLAVSARHELDLGDRRLVLEPRPTAHTDNDLTVRDAATGTLFMGDLLFAEHVPTLDGSIRGWLALLDGLEGEPAARVVPGHGPPALTWPHGAAPLKRYLGAVAGDVRRMIKDGKPLAEASRSAAAAERDHWQLFDDYHARNVSAAFAELEWE
jgi:quinoprotein relay system zinc metallohydrolase 2